MSNLLDERDARTKNRKKKKSEIDKLINLSVSGDNALEKVCLAPKDAKTLGVSGETVTHRLLDEGAILYADGEIDCFITKGTIEKYLNGENKYLKDRSGEVRNLTDGYVGTINYGHHDLATDPIALIGEWTKEDLHLVDIENGRKALNVDVKLNEDHIYVQQLRKLDYNVGLSAEFWCHYDTEKTNELGFGVIDEIFICDFAVVGECGNVNSSDLRLKGGLEMPKDKELTLEEIFEEEKAEDLSVEEEMVEETVEEVEKDAEIEEQAVETAEEEAETTEEVTDIEEETEDEVVDNEDAPVEESVEEVEDEEDMVSELMEIVKGLESENAKLKEHITAQNKTMNRLRKKLRAKNEDIAEFVRNYKNLSVEMGVAKEEPKEMGISSAYLNGDGIGE